MKAAQLRQSILQAAVQGKLVPQNIHDEPASELLEHIRQEKSWLVKEGKIKKEKPLPPIAEDETPYDLPDGWVWCRLGDITQFVATGPFGSMLHKSDYVNNGIPLVNPANMKNGIAVASDRMMVDEATRDRLSSYILHKDDIVVARRGDLGRCAIITENEDGWLCGTGSFFLHLSSFIYQQYFVLLFSSPVSREQLIGESVGTTMSNLNHGILKNLNFPLPPLAEQQRIVAKVDELMVLCDELEAAEKELDALESRFAEYLPKSILQAAVQGKLVPQNVHDEPATELLKRIQQEKVRLVREGKIKKEKPLPPIAEDEIPYDLPDGWVWCRLGGVVSLLEGEKASGNPLPYLEAKVLRGQKTPAIVDEGKFIKEGTKLILVDGENSGEIFISPMEGYMGSTFKVLHIVKALWLPFILRFIELHKDLFRNSKKGAAIPHLNKDIFFHLPLPLPPLAEQQRIVAKVDELMALCNKLKAARDISVKHITSNIVPFPQQGEDELEIGIAARGEMQELSEEAAQDIKEMFGDDCNG
ncbi:MAG: restriction endonuclease subunit S [Syntrophomonadaceae bacterium]|nr:restriction endonuclease subunit S [Syntrophomonadaceae bacterium]